MAALRIRKTCNTCNNNLIMFWLYHKYIPWPWKCYVRQEHNDSTVLRSRDTTNIVFWGQPFWNYSWRPVTMATAMGTKYFINLHILRYAYAKFHAFVSYYARLSPSPLYTSWIQLVGSHVWMHFFPLQLVSWSRLTELSGVGRKTTRSIFTN